MIYFDLDGRRNTAVYGRRLAARRCIDDDRDEDSTGLDEAELVRDAVS